MNIYRGQVFYFAPDSIPLNLHYHYFEDGALVVQEGKIIEVGIFTDVYAKWPNAKLIDYTGKIITPGFIDSHIHFPQIEIIGMYGRQLLDWLNEYTFPAEENFVSCVHAEEMAYAFVRELWRNGTTTCMAYATVHSESVNALFSVASKYNMRLLAGKVLMNRNAPENLLDTTSGGEEETRILIEKWHNKGRNSYVITPRFALTSTNCQLESAARLHNEYPDTYIQTHLSENKNEITSALEFHPECGDYLEIYERAGLVTDRSVFGHCIHLSEEECYRMSEAHAVVAHCPTSNLFLGSGLFNMEQAERNGLQVTLATDVGGGTCFSLLRTMGEAYKIQQLREYSLSPLESWYMCTLGTAKALKLDDKIGSFIPGNEADFIVIDPVKTSLQLLRSNYLNKVDKRSLENILFGLQILGDDRNIVATYIMGNKVYELNTGNH